MTTYSTSSGRRLERIHLGRAGRPEQEDDLAPVADRLIGQHPDPGDAQAARDQQQVAAARIDLERPAERPEHVHRVAGPQAGEPVGPPPDRPEVDRDDPGRRIDRVE